jgi:hypothetical protein
MIIRSVFSLVTLASAGVLSVALSGHLWDRYQEQTATLGFNGVYERALAAWAGFGDDPQAYRAFAEAARQVPLVVRQASALEE